jgi:hypothetical protein
LRTVTDCRTGSWQRRNLNLSSSVQGSDPDVLGPLGSILPLTQAKKLFLLNDMLSLQTNVMFLKQEICKKKLGNNLFFVGILKVTAKMKRIRIRNPVYGSKDPAPYPYQNVTDPETWLSRDS